jgi:hypothetical protein
LGVEDVVFYSWKEILAGEYFMSIKHPAHPENEC